MTLTNDHASGFTRINLWKINEYIESRGGRSNARIVIYVGILHLVY